MPGKPTSSVTSDNPKEYRKRAVDTHQKLAVQGANAGAECVLRDRDDLVDHDLRHLLETVGCGRLYREAEERSVEDLRGPQADRHTADGRKEIGLQDESRTGFAAVMAFGGDSHNIAPFYARSHAAISAMKFSVGFPARSGRRDAPADGTRRRTPRRVCLEPRSAPAADPCGVSAGSTGSASPAGSGSS
jgi:hypothetical protein